MWTEPLKDESTSYRFKGLLAFREYIHNTDVDQLLKKVEVKLEQKGEIETVGMRAPFLQMNTMFEGAFLLRGSVFMLALLSQEYDIAENILDHMNVVSIRALGELALGTLSMYLSDMYSEEKPLSDLNTIECMLYEKNCMISERLRTKIMNRIDREAMDVSQFSLKKIHSLNDLNVQILLLSDKKKYPNLFANEENLGANDLASLTFLMKMYSKNQQILRLLRNSRLYDSPFEFPKEENEEQINDDLNRILWIVNYLKGRGKTHEELYRFLIYRISAFRGNADRFRDKERIREALGLAENRIWEAITDLPFPDLFFENVMRDSKQIYMNPFRLEVLYELVYRKTGRKQPLIIKNSITNGMDMFFELWDETDEFDIDEGVYLCYADGARLLKLIQYADRIVYEESGDAFWNTLSRTLADLLLQNADQLQPSFALLISKGLIPLQCLPYVMRRVNRAKKCEYMRPHMIFLKFGGASGE